MDARTFGTKTAELPIALAAGLGGGSPEATLLATPGFRDKLLGHFGKTMANLPGELLQGVLNPPADAPAMFSTPAGRGIAQAGQAGLGALKRVAAAPAAAMSAVTNFAKPRPADPAISQMSTQPREGARLTDWLPKVTTQSPIRVSPPDFAPPSLDSALGGLLTPKTTGVGHGQMLKTNAAIPVTAPEASSPPRASTSANDSLAMAGPMPLAAAAPPPVTAPKPRPSAFTGMLGGLFQSPAGRGLVPPTGANPAAMFGAAAAGGPLSNPHRTSGGHVPSSLRSGKAIAHGLAGSLLGAGLGSVLTSPLPKSPTPTPAAPASSVSPPAAAAELMQSTVPAPPRGLQDLFNEDQARAAETPQAKLLAARKASGQVPTPESRARLQAARSPALAVGKGLPTKNPFLPQQTPPPDNPFTPSALPPLVKLNAASDFGKAAAEACSAPVRKPVSRVVKNMKPGSTKWSPGHQYQGGKTTKAAGEMSPAATAWLLTLLAGGAGGAAGAVAAPAGKRVRGAARGAAGGLGTLAGASLGVLPAMGVHAGMDAIGQPTLGRIGGVATGLGAAMLGRHAGQSLFDTIAPEPKEEQKPETKTAAMDVGMANGAIKAKAKPVTLREFTGSHKEMGKRLAEACN